MFEAPHRMCATSTGNLLVVDRGPKVVYEMTLAGDILRTLAVSNAFTVDAEGDMAVVGNDLEKDRITLLDLRTNTIVRSFGVRGSYNGQLSSFESVRFSHGGAQVRVMKVLVLANVTTPFAKRTGSVASMKRRRREPARTILPK